MATNKIEEITKEGREQLIKGREELLNVKIPECEAKVKAAREMGDTSENADYQFSKEELGRLKARRDQINYILENTKVVKNRETEKKVLLAKEVKVKRIDTGKEFTILLVSKHEVDVSNPEKMKISPNSPIGSALLGHVIGDVVLVNAKVPYELEILNITNMK